MLISEAVNISFCSNYHPIRRMQSQEPGGVAPVALPHVLVGLSVLYWACPIKGKLWLGRKNWGRPWNSPGQSGLAMPSVEPLQGAVVRMLPPGQPQVRYLVPAGCLQLPARPHPGHEAVQPDAKQRTRVVYRRSLLPTPWGESSPREVRESLTTKLLLSIVPSG